MTSLFLMQMDAAFLSSVVKPLVLVALLILWGRIACVLDRDAALQGLQRGLWAAIHFATGVVGVGLMLFTPVFIGGVLLGLLLIIAEVVGYVFYRNAKVSPDMRWNLDMDTLRQLDFGLSQTFENVAEARAVRSASFQFIVKDDRVTPPAEDDPMHAPHTVLENALRFALPRGADRLEWNVDPKQGTVAIRIDGVRYPMDPMPAQTAVHVIDYVKHAVGLDIQDRRRKQTATVGITLDDLGEHTLAIGTSGSTRGLNMMMGIDGAENAKITVDELGMLEKQRQRVKTFVADRGGVVLVTGPAGQGVSTSLYAFAQEHDPYTSSIVAYEDETFYEVEGVAHELVAPGATADAMNDRLGAILRAEPAVVLLSRIADARMAQAIARHAEETRFYIQLPRATTLAALKTWVKAVGDYKLAADSLRAITTQRLIRKLCPTCRVAYQPDPAALKKMNISPDRVKQLCRATGKLVDPKKGEQTCPTCVGMGYRGRVSVYEIMSFDAQAKALVASADVDGLRTHLRKQGMLYLQEAALSHVIDGITDIREVQRALAEGQKG